MREYALIKRVIGGTPDTFGKSPSWCETDMEVIGYRALALFRYVCRYWRNSLSTSRF